MCGSCRMLDLDARLTFAIAANGDVTLVRLLKNLNILNKKYPIFDFDFDDFDSRVPAYRSHDNPARALPGSGTTLNLVLEYTLEYYGMSTIDSTRVRSVRPYSKSTSTAVRLGLLEYHSVYTQEKLLLDYCRVERNGTVDLPPL